VQAVDLWIILELGIELILLGLVSYALLIWKKERLAQPWKRDVELLANQVSQADALAVRIYQELGSRIDEFKELFQKLEHKEAQLNVLITRAGEAAMELDSPLESHGPDRSYERYREMIRLSQQGFSIEEISKRTGIGENEINLALRLRGGERK